MKKGHRHCLTSHKERWRKATATAWHHITSSCETVQKPCKTMNPEGRRSACMRNSRTPAGFQPKRWPNLREPTPEKLSNVAFWGPKERWRKATATAWHLITSSFETVQKPCKSMGPEGRRSACMRNSQTPTGFQPKRWPNLREPSPEKLQPPKKCLTLLSDALRQDEERLTQLLDTTWQAASKPFHNHAKPWVGRGKRHRGMVPKRRHSSRFEAQVPHSLLWRAPPETTGSADINP